MRHDLGARTQAVTEFQADARRAVHTKEIGKEVPRRPKRDRTTESVREAEAERARRQPQGRRERAQREVRFGEIQLTVIGVLGRSRSGMEHRTREQQDNPGSRDAETTGAMPHAR
jgi:hypothetical protein